MKLLRLLPLFATLLPLPAQGPSGDPAAAPEGEAKPRQVSIQFDWIKQPRFQSMRTTCQLAVLPGAPSMIAAFDAPVTDGKTQPHARPRKVLLFIRAIL